MLKIWTEILPVFIVRKLAIRMCEYIDVDKGLIVARARKDVLFVVPQKADLLKKEA